MFWGIVSSVLSVFNTFAYQRAISAGIAVGASMMFRTFYNNAVVIPLIAAILLVASPFSNFANVDFGPYLSAPLIPFLAVGASFAGIVCSLVGQYVYANEKAGVLAPYNETGRLFTIVAGFFLFADSSAASFASALAAIFAIIVFSIDFRSFSFNKYCAILAVSGVFRAFSSLAIGYVALKATPFTITLFDVTLATFVALGVLLWKKDFPVFVREKFVALTGWTAVNDGIWLVTFVISLFLLKDIGIVATSLLGMLSLVLTIVFDSVRIRKFPSPKISALAAIVTVSVLAGSLYR
ncbi:MAG: hypothetical protein QG650_427 [Patescibacteria group bacterium]|nr:hypothetical protein [Patescibacteria group bacterium]